MTHTGDTTGPTADTARPTADTARPTAETDDKARAPATAGSCSGPFRQNDVFDPLEREWAALAQSRRLRTAFRRWRRDDPRFGCVNSAAAAVAAVVQAPDPVQRYGLTSALLRQAGRCALAERALLQAHVPAICAVSRKARGWTTARLRVSYGVVSEVRDGRVSRAVWADLDAIAVGAAAEWIRDHAGEELDWAGLKMRDHVRNRLRSFVWADLRRSSAEQIAAEQPPMPHANAGAELIELLRNAQRDAVLNPDQLRLIISNRILGLSDREVGRREFVSAATANRMRHRFERQLATSACA